MASIQENIGHGIVVAFNNDVLETIMSKVVKQSQKDLNKMKKV